ncbi:MAG: methyltransferase [Pseudomonadales bacterium]|nr:methyltransferase [Pseudomonadales bacterium]
MHTSALLRSALDAASHQSVLWLLDENTDTETLANITPAPGLQVLTNRYDLYQVLSAKGHTVVLNDFDFSALPQTAYQRIVYRISKEKALVHHCVNAAFRHLPDGGQLLLLGSKSEGIKTFAKTIAQVFNTRAQIDKKGTSYRVTVSKSGSTETPRWLDEQQYPQLRELNGKDGVFLSKPGIYGWQKTDRGSALLAATATSRYADATRIDSLLDLGCGYGYLLLATQALPCTRRHATDNNVAAVTAAAANFRRRGLEVTVSLDDCGSKLQERFSLILCNPPFHQGFKTSQALTRRFLQQLQKLCQARGEALLVVNQFIAVEKPALEHFHTVEVLLQQDGFSIISLRHPRQGGLSS